MIKMMTTTAKRTPQVITLDGNDQKGDAQDMRDFNGALFGVTKILGATVLVSATVKAYSDAALTADETVVQAADNLPAAVGDVAFIEVSDAQVKQAQVDAGVANSLRYVALVVNGVAAEEVHVMAELGRAQCEEEGLTVDIIA